MRLAKIPLTDHRVDDLLDQQRVEEPQQLHEKARNHHLDQAVAVLSDGRNEPAEAKAGLGGAGVSLEIEQVKGLTLTLALKLIAGNPLLTPQRITDEELSVLLLPEDDRVAVQEAKGR